jgi:hypothetical protein
MRAISPSRGSPYLGTVIRYPESSARPSPQWSQKALEAEARGAVGSPVKVARSGRSAPSSPGVAGKGDSEAHPTSVGARESVPRRTRNTAVAREGGPQEGTWRGKGMARGPVRVGRGVEGRARFMSSE